MSGSELEQQCKAKDKWINRLLIGLDEIAHSAESLNQCRAIARKFLEGDQ